MKERASSWVETILRELNGHHLKGILGYFLGLKPQVKPPGIVYALGTREAPDMLKVGMTTRDPVQRVKEINSATGNGVCGFAGRRWRAPARPARCGGGRC